MNTAALIRGDAIALPLADDDITEEQLADFGVLLARYEAEAVA